MKMWAFLVALLVCGANAFNTKYSVYKKTNGFDHRPKLFDASPPLQSYVIAKFFEKKRLLDVLKHPQISIHRKIGLLPKPEITPANLFAGGLMKDFLFDMEE
jgi:hypothetical protein